MGRRGVFKGCGEVRRQDCVHQRWKVKARKLYFGRTASRSDWPEGVNGRAKDKAQQIV